MTWNWMDFAAAGGVLVVLWVAIPPAQPWILLFVGLLVLAMLLKDWPTVQSAWTTISQGG